MFVPRVASAKVNEAKNAAARLSQLSINRSGSQKYCCPYRTYPADVTVMPIKATNVNTTGMMMS
jgi:hypothetical protein